MLIRFNFPSDIIEIIMSCVSTVSTSILFNGEALEPIYPSRGIRQGDPLSSYLFILCMELLGQLIQEKCRLKLWQPIKASRSGPAFSHLLFADDLVFFARADYINCGAIRDVIDEFCSASGQSISESKSKVYFSPNVDRDIRESLCDILGFNSTPNLGKYLGFPIKHSRTSAQDFNFILDKVKQKLAGWKANMLSLAGRSVLIQASSATIPSYVMQSVYLPQKILDGIDRVNRNFLWGSSDAAKKIHWVGWHKVAKPKEEGGLGLQAAKGRNVALLAKLNWRFHMERGKPWAEVLRMKYCNQRRVNTINANRLPCSQTWRAMKKGMKVFTKGSKWAIGRDSTLNLWQSYWTEMGPLRHLIQGPLLRGAEVLVVKDIIKDTGWDWDQIPFDLPSGIKMMIQATPLSLTGRGGDKLTWAGNPRGIFDLKSAYSLAMEAIPVPPFFASWIWKVKTLPRIKTFLWMCSHNSIGVKSCLVRRGVINDEMCPVCQRESESILHALRDCSSVKAVWCYLGIQATNRDFWNANLQEWLNANGRMSKSLIIGKPPWSMIFPFAIWNVWKSRNKFVFKRKTQNPGLAAEIIKQTEEFLYCVYSPRSPICKVIKRICWERPPEGWAKLNTDGALCTHSGSAGCGGVVRDDRGEWVAGFSRRIGATNSFMAELWGLRDGLILCSNLHLPSLIIELDAKAIVDALLNLNYENNVISPILEDCR